MSDLREDTEFLAGYDPDAFPHPSLAVDVVILTVVDRSLRVLLRRRDQPPQRGRWSLPGGFVGMEESLDAAARRVLRRAGGPARAHLEQLHTFGALRRDPRHRVVTVAYHALVAAPRLRDAGSLPVLAGPVDQLRVIGSDGAARRLAFDHADIVTFAVERLRSAIADSAQGLRFLDEPFTLRELQDVHEAVLGTRVNKDSFRRRMLASGHLAPTGEREADVEHRPAELFRLAGGPP